MLREARDLSQKDGKRVIKINCEGGYTINLSYGWVVEEVILPVEEVIHFCGGGYSHSCDFSVSPSPFGLDFGTLGLRTWA